MFLVAKQALHRAGFLARLNGIYVAAAAAQVESVLGFRRIAFFGLMTTVTVFQAIFIGIGVMAGSALDILEAGMRLVCKDHLAEFGVKLDDFLVGRDS